MGRFCALRRELIGPHRRIVGRNQCDRDGDARVGTQDWPAPWICNIRERMRALLRLLVGPDGKLRFIWRAAIFWMIAEYALPLVFTPFVIRTAGWLKIPDALNAPTLALGEVSLLVMAFIATALLALYERRRVDDYGLPVRQALSSNTAEGALVGVAMTGVVAGGM